MKNVTDYATFTANRLLEKTNRILMRLLVLSIVLSLGFATANPGLVD